MGVALTSVNFRFSTKRQSVFTFVVYYDFYTFSSFNIDVGVVRWPPAGSCGRVVMGDAHPSLFICVVLQSGFRDTAIRYTH